MVVGFLDNFYKKWILVRSILNCLGFELGKIKMFRFLRNSWNILVEVILLVNVLFMSRGVSIFVIVM